ncbi:hypothetical protein [Clostridium sp. Ade.TY]|uniref:hypothetical protein n=1 Tax=Clostridium sp. Ade.TY TaxID=1391647 RepID=UPI000425114D|nr:hypothetical protein [Clostridium sp. Ade.TY]
MKKKSIIIFFLLFFILIGTYFIFNSTNKSNELVKNSNTENTIYVNAIELNSNLKTYNYSKYNDKVVEITGEITNIYAENKELLLKGAYKNIKVNLQEDQDLTYLNIGSTIAVKGIALIPESNTEDIILKSSIIEVK